MGGTCHFDYGDSHAFLLSVGAFLIVDLNHGHLVPRFHCCMEHKVS